MTGEELKQYIKRSGLTMSDIAREMGTTPQNIQARLSRQSIKPDFLAKVEGIINKCCPPLPIEMESAIAGSNINVVNSQHVTQTIGDAALLAENKLLKQQNDFLQKQIETLLNIINSK